MNKYIKLIILCIALMLYGCGDSQVNRGAIITDPNSPIAPPIVLPTTEIEGSKFNFLIKVFDLAHDHTSRKPIPNDYKEKITNFKTWLSNNTQKQQELVNAFTEAYNYLKIKRQKYAPNENFDEYIENAILVEDSDNQNNKYGPINIYPFSGLGATYNVGKNSIGAFFARIITELIYDPSHPPKISNEELFNIMIQEMGHATNMLKQNWP
ncbi:Mlp family lipoprotein [Borrelia puertoricensis]|uniref:Mlp family lipoprotein n=1 Tax=Borrelia puertoricensis TaxID=2756107 RepID=UPI001FF2B8A0|nr:Mlp family lipoprotein [Borrelia puertoricensis]UPA18667.1 Mlp family lipoprotein [Borrelia puertoricensis]